MLFRSSAFLLIQGLGLVSAVTTTTATSAICTPTSVQINTLRTCTVSCGIDRPGGDFAVVQTFSVNGCLQACANNNQCLTAQYAEGNGYCYLKNLVNRAASVDGVDTIDCSTTTTSACSPVTSSINGRSCTTTCGQDRPGGDYKSLQAKSFSDCVAACASDAQCVDAQYRQSNNYCYLKNTLTDPTSDADVNSVVCGPTAPSVDTSSDIDNCGTVGTKCANNRYCVSGSCVPRKNLCTSTQSSTTGQCSQRGCFCWGTTEDTDFCASGRGPTKAGPCNTSRDCPNGQSCLDIRTYTGWRGACTDDSNSDICPNPNTQSAKFLLLRR